MHRVLGEQENCVQGDADGKHLMEAPGDGRRTSQQQRVATMEDDDVRKKQLETCSTHTDHIRGKQNKKTGSASHNDQEEVLSCDNF
jgi:hypothetical protein